MSISEVIALMGALAALLTALGNVIEAWRSKAKVKDQETTS